MRFHVLFVSLVLAVFSCISFAQKPNFDKVAIDSVALNDAYTLVVYKVTGKDSLTLGKSGNQMVIYHNGMPSKLTVSKTISVYDFNKGKKKGKPLYAKDINGDGLLEVLVTGHTGLGTCCNHLNIQSLGEKAIADVGQMEMRDVADFTLKDLDDDSIPEVIFADANYLGWKAPIEDSPKPILIWKWHEGAYKVANFSYPEYFEKQVTKKRLKKLARAIKKRASKESDPENEYLKYPAPELWGVMLDYFYAGKDAMADSIFNQYWPEKLPGKDEFYTEFREKVREAPYWLDILDSKLEK